MCMVWPCHSFLMAFTKNALMCILTKVELINNVCLPISMLLYLMLYVMLAYLMLFTSSCNAACLCNAHFFCDFCKCVLISCFVFLVY